MLRQRTNVDDNGFGLGIATITIRNLHDEGVVTGTREENLGRGVVNSGEGDFSAVHFDPLVSVRNERSDEGIIRNISDIEVQGGGVAEALIAGARDGIRFDSDMLRTIEEDDVLCEDITASVGDLSHHREVIFLLEDVNTVDGGLVSVLPEELEGAHQVSAVGAVVEDMRSDGIHEGHAVGRVERAVAALDREQADQREFTGSEHEGRLRGILAHEHLREGDRVAAVILNGVGSGNNLVTGRVRDAVHNAADIGDRKEILVAVVAEDDASASFESSNSGINRSIGQIEVTSIDVSRDRSFVNSRIDGIVGDVVEHNGFRLTTVGIDNINRGLISSTAAVGRIRLVVSSLVRAVGGETSAFSEELHVVTSAGNRLVSRIRIAAISTHTSVRFARILEVSSIGANVGLVINRDNQVLGAVIDERVLQFDFFPAGRAVEADSAVINERAAFNPLLVGIVERRSGGRTQINLHVVSRESGSSGVLESNLGDLASTDFGSGEDLLRVVVLSLVAQRESRGVASTVTNLVNRVSHERHSGAVEVNLGHITVPLISIRIVGLVRVVVDLHLQGGLATRTNHGRDGSHGNQLRSLVQSHRVGGEVLGLAVSRLIVRHGIEIDGLVDVRGGDVVDHVDREIITGVNEITEILSLVVVETGADGLVPTGGVGALRIVLSRHVVDKCGVDDFKTDIRRGGNHRGIHFEERDIEGHRIAGTDNRIQILGIELVEIGVGVHLADDIRVSADNGVDVGHLVVPAVTIGAPIVPHELVVGGVFQIERVVSNHAEQLLRTERGAFAEGVILFEHNDFGSVADKEMESVDAVRLEVFAIGVVKNILTEHHVGVGHSDMEVILRTSEDVVFVFADLFGEFAEVREIDGVFSKNSAAAGLVTADEVGGFVFVPGQVVPRGTADAFADAHDQFVVTDLFPFELDDGPGLLEEVEVEIIKMLAVDVDHTVGRHNLAELGKHSHRGALFNLHGAGVVGRIVAGAVQTMNGVVQAVVACDLGAAAELVRNFAAQPFDGLALTVLIQLAIQCIDSEINIVGQIVIDKLTVAVEQPID